MCLLYENADKPNVWLAGKLAAKTIAASMGAARGEDWHFMVFEATPPDGKILHGPCAVNCNNRTDLYSFHPGGANLVLGDGSVRFINEDVDIWIMYAVITRNGREVIAAEDFSRE